MNKKKMARKIALIIYPEFSVQEIANLSALFRWHFDTITDTFSSSREVVKSEEGFLINPNKTFDEFDINEYDCLILSGCSDLRKVIRDEKLIQFLETFKGNNDFVIGAICSSPVFLSKAGLLENKKFINSLYIEMNSKFSFIQEKNIVYKPVVEDGNIITAVGNAYKQFAIAIARNLGYECSDSAYFGISDKWRADDFKFNLSKEGLKQFEEEFSDLF